MNPAALSEEFHRRSGRTAAALTGGHSRWRLPATLAGIAGTPPVLDLVHLGLGPDGLHPWCRATPCSASPTPTLPSPARTRAIAG